MSAPDGGMVLQLRDGDRIKFGPEADAYYVARVSEAPCRTWGAALVETFPAILFLSFCLGLMWTLHRAMNGPVHGCHCERCKGSRK